MQLLSQINITRPGGDAVIQLLHGDLSAIPVEHQTDLLVLSAFPGDYYPVSTTLIGALFNKGLSVKELSMQKEEDLREQLNCWLSKPLSKTVQLKFNFKRIICFEPNNKINAPQEVVGNIFRCINTFAFDEKNNVVAMPIVSSGCQRAKPEEMLPALLDAAIFWLENGLPLQCIKLVIHREAQVPMALGIFEKIKNTLVNKTGAGDVEMPSEEEHITPVFDQDDFSSTGDGHENVAGKAITRGERYSEDENIETGRGAAPVIFPSSAPAAVAPSPAQVPAPVADGYDYFISYAHTHAPLVHSFVQQVKEKCGHLNIFYDRDSIAVGGLWIRQLSAAIQKANKVLVFLSPDYDRSPVCWDEFQCAKLMEYKKKTPIIQTIYLYDYKEVEMSPIMGIYSYVDCREGDTAKLKDFIEKVLVTPVTMP